MDISIIIPTYNEEATISNVIENIKSSMDKLACEYEIVVVDDGSKDRTASIVKQKDYAKLIQHIVNRGVGAARKTGMNVARGKLIGMIDGDGTYPVDKLPKMIEMLKDFDMVIGARQIEKGSLRPLRSMAKYTIKKLASFLTKTNILDLNSGLRVFRKDIAVKYSYILPDGHSWVSTITLAFLTDNYRVGFMPIPYFDRKGISSFRPIKDTYNYIMAVITTVTYFNPLRIFMPLSAISFLVFCVFFLHDVITFNIQGSTIIMLVVSLFTFFFGLIADQLSKIRKELNATVSKKHLEG